MLHLFSEQKEAMEIISKSKTNGINKNTEEENKIGKSKGNLLFSNSKNQDICNF